MGSDGLIDHGPYGGLVGCIEGSCVYLYAGVAGGDLALERRKV